MEVLLLSLCSSSLDTASAQPSKYFCSVSTCRHRMSLKVSISASFSLRLWPFYRNNTTTKRFNGRCRARASSAQSMSSSAGGEIYNKARLKGGCGGGGIAAGGWCEGQHGAVSPQAGLWSISRISLWWKTQINNVVTELHNITNNTQSLAKIWCKQTPTQEKRWNPKLFLHLFQT